MENKYEFLDHMADIKIKSYGISIEQVFENAVIAVSSYLTSKKKIKSKLKKEISFEFQNPESALYNFIDQIIYLIDAEDFISSSAKVKIVNNSLTATLSGDKASNYRIQQVKAATYAEMHIKEISKNKWEAQFVIDV